MPSRILYVFHGRFPDPRAAALFAVQEAISFSELVPVEIIVPKRSTTDIALGREHHHIPDSVSIRSLPVLELSGIPFLRRFAFHASLLTFAYGLGRYLRTLPQDSRSSTWVVTVDPLVSSVAKKNAFPSLLEIHDFPSKKSPFWIRGLTEATLLLATNQWKAKALMREFGQEEKKIITEPNGVDVTRFSKDISTVEARTRIGVSTGVSLAVYTGNLYDWKGVDTLIKAAEQLSDISIAVVGGTEEECSALRALHIPNLLIPGRVTHEEVPYWQAAADVLVLPNTARQDISLHYTSPMKLFEYMAMMRPIVASRIPSIEELVDDASAVLVTPDDSTALAEGIRTALTEGKESTRTSHAFERVRTHAWNARAKRILPNLSV